MKTFTVEEVKGIIRTLSKCENCGGYGKCQPECYACLIGDPNRCTCKSEPEITCPACEGTGWFFEEGARQMMNDFIKEYGEL